MYISTSQIYFLYSFILIYTVQSLIQPYAREVAQQNCDKTRKEQKEEAKKIKLIEEEVLLKINVHAAIAHK